MSEWDEYRKLIVENWKNVDDLKKGRIEWKQEGKATHDRGSMNVRGKSDLLVVLLPLEAESVKIREPTNHSQAKVESSSLFAITL